MQPLTGPRGRRVRDVPETVSSRRAARRLALSSGGSHFRRRKCAGCASSWSAFCHRNGLLSHDQTKRVSLCFRSTLMQRRIKVGPVMLTLRLPVAPETVEELRKNWARVQLEELAKNCGRKLGKKWTRMRPSGLDRARLGLAFGLDIEWPMGDRVGPKLEGERKEGQKEQRRWASDELRIGNWRGRVACRMEAACCCWRARSLGHGAGADCLRAGFCLPFTAHCWPLTACCRHCALLTVGTAFCLLLTAYCSPPTAHP